MKLPFNLNLPRLAERREKQVPSEGMAANTSVRTHRNLGWWPEDIYEKNPALRIPRRFDTYRRFLRSIPVVGAFSEMYAGIVAETAFKFEGDNDDRAEELLGALLNAQQLRWLSDGLLYGFSVLEWRCESDWTITDAWQLPHATVVKADIVDNEVLQFYQWVHDGTGLLMLPAWKSCYTIRGVVPYGEGILMKIADQALRFLQNSTMVAAASDENLMNRGDWAVPAAAKPGDKTVEEIRAHFKTHRDAFERKVVPPSDLQVSNSMDGSNRLIAREKYARTYPPRADIKANDLRETYERQMARVLGLEAFMHGDSSTGSFALANVQVGAFLALVRGGVGLVRDALQKTLDFQYEMTGGMAPTITADWTTWSETSDLAELLVKLNQAGVQFTPESKAVQEVLMRAGLSTVGLAAVEPEGDKANKPEGDKENPAK